MRRIDLNFSSRAQPAGAARWVGLLLGIVALVGVMAWDRLYWQPLIATNEKQLRSLQMALAARQPVVPKMDDVQLAAEWGQALAVAGTLNLPWEKLFATLEGQSVGQVALLSLEPDAVRRELVLTAEGRSLKAMLGFYKMLQQQGDLSAVVLHSHQVNQQDSEKPVRFHITAKWAASS
ncbi:MAG TPA: hypothetical protein PLB25_01985 [Rhodoferax sp.]|nr:hypothetical protein [Rhodoferax sp.]